MFANMTLDSSDHENKLILSMDRFVGKVKEVDCSSNMMIRFTSNDTYMDAISQWEWVNFNEHRTFILIANYPGCAENQTREPWIVSNVDYSPETLTVHLDAKRSTWEVVGKTFPFKVDFGQHFPSTQTSITKRFLGGIIDKVTDKVDDVVDKGKEQVTEVVNDVKDTGEQVVDKGKEEVTEVVNDVKDTGENIIDKVEDKVNKLKNAIGDPNKQFTVNLNKSLPRQLFSKSINGINIDVECNGGAVKGSVMMKGSISFDGNGIDSLILDMEPRNVGIDVPITVTASGVLGSGFDLPIDIGTIPAIPGFAVTGLFALGPTLQFDAGISVSAVSGSITISSGFSVFLKDGAKASFDVKSEKELGVSGWSASGKAKPFKVEAAEVSAEAEVYVSTGVYLEASLFDKFGGQAGFTLRAPVRVIAVGQHSEWLFNLQGFYVLIFSVKNGEVCPNSRKPSGVKLSGTAGVEVVVEAFGEVMNRKHSFFEKVLVDKSDLLTLPSYCFALGNEQTSALSPIDYIGGDGVAATAESSAVATTLITKASATRASSTGAITDSNSAAADRSRKGSAAGVQMRF